MQIDVNQVHNECFRVVLSLNRDRDRDRFLELVPEYPHVAEYEYEYPLSLGRPCLSVIGSSAFSNEKLPSFVLRHLQMTPTKA